MPAFHRHAAILAIGDELTLGQKSDTNSQWLSARLVDLGVMPGVRITIPDDRAAHARILVELARSHDLILSTGGLGPTDDDLTRHALADAMGEGLVEDEGALETLRVHAASRGHDLTLARRLQAMRPPSARMLPNRFGTAPGIHATLERADIFCLPGPPREMVPMFDACVAPALRADPARAVTTRVLHSFGLPEAEIGTRLADLMQRGCNPTVGTTASGGVVSVRIRYEGEAGAGATATAGVEGTVRGRLAPHVFGGGADTLASVVVRALSARCERLVIAESCTGGTLAGAITEISGSSEVFETGLVTYADATKTRLLGVPEELLRSHGAVSEPVARAMGEGALRSPGGASARHALAITGIAGPSGGTPAKPVGTVFIARSSRDGGEIGTEVRRFLISGARADIRERTVTIALAILHFHMSGVATPHLLWQVPLQGAKT
ncbi:MAG: CinA family nicotinamide mononucleotide deamidase-related protein [Phycisphaeraceae bacterium]|nr:CinA family nicotinamide mononucleotide deamidase-related protein [Phycisphaerales bacterium]MCB9844242.1 CinA family nicotinamide mononucleotide deamidase-related protein [Phycisphaeraceae bacterium]